MADVSFVSAATAAAAGAAAAEYRLCERDMLQFEISQDDSLVS